MRTIRIAVDDNIIFIPEDKILCVEEKDLSVIVIELINGKTIKYQISDLVYADIKIIGKGEGICEVLKTIINEWKINFEEVKNEI